MANDTIFTKIPDLNYSESAVEIEANEFEKTVRSRRSVRIYTDEKIPEAITRRCLSLALLAPNSSNLQPWEFYWIKNKEKREEIIKACLSQNAAKTSAELIVCVARTKTFKKNSQQMLELLEKSKDEVPQMIKDYYGKLAPLVYNQGLFGILGFIKRLIIPIIGIFKVVPRGPSSWADMRLWANKTTALACQNLMLAFRAYGYDTCPMEGFDEKRVKKILKLPKDASCTMIISAGKRSKEGVYGPQIRFPEEQFIIEVI